MKVVFLSNYYNHHQASFCRAMDRLTNGQFVFIETDKIGEERIKLGYSVAAVPQYVKKIEEKEEECRNDIEDSDAVILGYAPYALVEKRIRRKKLTFRYEERWYREGFTWWKQPVWLLKHQYRFRNERNVYILCAGGYVAGDCARTGLFLNRTYKWGYFPETREYELPEVPVNQKRPCSILWCGRFLNLKHPELAVNAAERLYKAGYPVTLNMIGMGPMEEALRKTVADRKLENCVRFLGSMTPEKVRDHMEEAAVFLFTSDYNEGWGAVLNEAMNSGCAVVASHAIGSVPFLIRDGKNGLIYRNEKPQDLYNKVEKLIKNPEYARRLGMEAYRTITAQWNAENAAQQFLLLTRAILNGEKHPETVKEGPGSKAKVLFNNWYKA